MRLEGMGVKRVGHGAAKVSTSWATTRASSLGALRSKSARSERSSIGGRRAWRRFGMWGGWELVERNGREPVWFRRDEHSYGGEGRKRGLLEGYPKGTSKGTID